RSRVVNDAEFAQNFEPLRCERDDADDAISAARDHDVLTADMGHRDARDDILMPFEHGERLAAAEIEHADGVVSTARHDDILAAGTGHRDARNRTLMPFEHGERLAAAEIDE